ncbi:MAG: ATP-binding protein [Clostridiaceae bacterium]|jgi:DNA replication protein DnaC|nr:ATP-binding protein [Clostridiaceae bacterium]
MSSNVYKLIRNEYDRRRANALSDFEERKQSLYYHIPRLEEIEEEISQAGLKYNKAILMEQLSSDSAIGELSDTIERLNAERTSLLEKNGYSAQYLTPSFQCKRCSDTGVIKSETGGADTLCICYRQQLIDMLYDQSNLSTVNTKGFESFVIDYYPDVVNEKRYSIKSSPRRQILGILDNCRSFVDNFSNTETNNLLFSGPTGVGKTFLAGCISMELMKRGHTVLYQTAPALFNTIYEYRYNSANNDDWESAVYSNILQSDLLIIDDLGTESPTGMRYSELLNIINTRLANDTRKPCKIIISTNLSLRELFEYYDERIVSRLTGGFDIFRFAGDDIRRLKKD